MTQPTAQEITERLGQIRQAEADAGGYLDRKQRNYDVRHALWSGQSEDGRKHSDSLGRQAFPWEGASDARIRLADQIVNENVAILISAFFRSKLQLQPVESSDYSAKVAAETALRWMLFQHCADDLRREVELLAQMQEQYGLGIMGIFWRRTTRTESKTISMDELLARLAETGQPMIQILIESIVDPEQQADAVRLLGELIDPAAAKAAIVRDLRTKGTATYDSPYLYENRPEFIALEPWEDVFFPAGTGDLQRAPFIAWRERVTETELRERSVTDGYDADFVEAAVKHKGSTTSILRTFRDSMLWDEDRDKIEIWHHYSKSSNTDQTTRIDYCVMHQSVPDAVALCETMPFLHGEYPFVEFPRERISRALLDSRGVPEILQSSQLEIKTQRDYRADRASIATLPPVRVPANRGKLNLIFGPGAQVPERRPGEFGWMEPPPFDRGTIEVEASVRSDVDTYFGRFTAAVQRPLSLLSQQTMVDRWLRSCRAVISQAFALMQQYMSDVEILRVAGAAPAKFAVSRAEIQGRYDMTAEFDVRDLDAEVLGSKLDVISKVAVPLDVAGVIDRAGLVQFVMNAIDPSLAQQIVRPAEAAAAAEADDEQLAFTKIAAGTEPPLPGQGVNAPLRAQVLTRIVQANPALKTRYDQDEIFRSMLDARMKALNFQTQQIQNAQIGRMGAVPALDTMQQQEPAFAA